MKRDLKDILKNGENFVLKNIDFNDPKIRKRLKNLKIEQQRIINRTKINYEDLRKIIITI